MATCATFWSRTIGRTSPITTGFDGPALGGFLLAALGAAAVYGIDVLSYVVVSAALLWWPREAGGRRGPAGAVRRRPAGRAALRPRQP